MLVPVEFQEGHEFVTFPIPSYYLFTSEFKLYVMHDILKFSNNLFYKWFSSSIFPSIINPPFIDIEFSGQGLHSWV
jgi:hypothetical protein